MFEFNYDYNPKIDRELGVNPTRVAQEKMHAYCTLIVYLLGGKYNGSALQEVIGGPGALSATRLPASPDQQKGGVIHKGVPAFEGDPRYNCLQLNTRTWAQVIQRSNYNFMRKYGLKPETGADLGPLGLEYGSKVLAALKDRYGQDQVLVNLTPCSPLSASPEERNVELAARVTALREQLRNIVTTIAIESCDALQIPALNKPRKKRVVADHPDKTTEPTQPDGI